MPSACLSSSHGRRPQCTRRGVTATGSHTIKGLRPGPAPGAGHGHAGRHGGLPVQWMPHQASLGRWAEGATTPLPHGETLGETGFKVHVARAVRCAFAARPPSRVLPWRAMVSLVAAAAGWRDLPAEPGAAPSPMDGRPENVARVGYQLGGVLNVVPCRGYPGLPPGGRKRYRILKVRRTRRAVLTLTF